MRFVVLEIIGAVADAIAVHIIMAMSFIPVVVVIFTCATISMPAVAICSARVSFCNKREI